MNELLFFLQILFAFSSTYLFFRQGKEALFVWLGILSLLANLFVSKQIVLFGMDVTASDVYAVTLIFTLNLLQEYWGKEQSRKGGMIAVVAQIAFLFFAEVHLRFQPNQHDASQQAYQTILGIYPRLLAASCLTLFIVQFFDRWFFALLNRWMKGAAFRWRNAIALSVSQLLDTALFSLLGLYGIVGNILDVFLMSFAIKVILISTLPFLTLWIKPKTYDISL